MKAIAKVLKHRWIIGTMTIITVSFILTMATGRYGVAILTGNMIPFWWLYCFITRNRHKTKKGEV